MGDNESFLHQLIVVKSLEHCRLQFCLKDVATQKVSNLNAKLAWKFVQASLQTGWARCSRINQSREKNEGCAFILRVKAHSLGWEMIEFYFVQTKRERRQALKFSQFKSREQNQKYHNLIIITRLKALSPRAAAQSRPIYLTCVYLWSVTDLFAYICFLQFLGAPLRISADRIKRWMYENQVAVYLILSRLLLLCYIILRAL